MCFTTCLQRPGAAGCRQPRSVWVCPGHMHVHSFMSCSFGCAKSHSSSFLTLGPLNARLNAPDCSGQCFSSEAWGGRSANRGQCAQACRLPYGESAALLTLPSMTPR